MQNQVRQFNCTDQISTNNLNRKKSAFSAIDLCGKKTVGVYLFSTTDKSMFRLIFKIAVFFLHAKQISQDYKEAWKNPQIFITFCSQFYIFFFASFKYQCDFGKQCWLKEKEEAEKRNSSLFRLSPTENNVQTLTQLISHQIWLSFTRYMPLLLYKLLSHTYNWEPISHIDVNVT